ncbi:hypothetical protein AAG570_003893 [Ranatra chinensis]|uniref:Translation initiation factor eIF2B subunit gamma n=1 Tax=Ranatra chinensis TaxID=642074 RepID=A0ABD0Y2J2_9HEMI
MAAGKGSRMTEMTAKKAKCLLPIGNLPMIWFPIHLLERSGFQEVIVVILEPVKNEVQAALDKLCFKIKIELVGIQSEDTGTADSLRYLQESNRIRCDVLVVSCDLVTDVNLVPLFDLYRKHDAAYAALFVQNKTSVQTLATPGPKMKDKPERDFVGINGATSRLVFIGSASDYEEVVPMSRKNLIKRYGRITIHSKLMDAHLYIIKKWLCEYLVTKKSVSTLKGELLPYVVKKHVSHGNKLKIEQDKTSVIGMDLKKDITQFAQENALTCKIRTMSAYTDSRCQVVYNNDSIRCYAHVVTDDSYAVRINTLQQYCRLNREILDKWSTLTGSRELVRIAPSASVKSTQLDAETCLVGAGCQIAEKTSLKNTILGPSVTVSTKTRIANSVVMHGVRIGEGCNIQNCVICEDSIVQDGCELKDCLVGSQHVVQANSMYSTQQAENVLHKIFICHPASCFFEWCS